MPHPKRTKSPAPAPHPVSFKFNYTPGGGAKRQKQFVVSFPWWLIALVVTSVALAIASLYFPIPDFLSAPFASLPSFSFSFSLTPLFDAVEWGWKSILGGFASLSDLVQKSLGLGELQLGFFSYHFIGRTVGALIIIKILVDTICSAGLTDGHGARILGWVPIGFFACPEPSHHAPQSGKNDEIYTSNSKRTFTYNERGYYHSFIDVNKPCIVFLHGNGEPACCWLNTFLSLFRNTHNIVAFEYFGYGRRSDKTTSHYLLAKQRFDIADMWAHMHKHFGHTYFANNNEVLLMGFSLGGGFAWSSVDILSPPPSKLVLVNTFADLSLLIKDKLSLVNAAFLFPLLQSFLLPWNITGYSLASGHTGALLPPDAALNQAAKSAATGKKWRGKVLVVYTVDDELFPSSHAALFKQHFNQVVKCKEYAEYRCESGGHGGGPGNYRGWLKLL